MVSVRDVSNLWINQKEQWLRGLVGAAREPPFTIANEFAATEIRMHPYGRLAAQTDHGRKGSTPMKRPAQPEEIAPAFVHFASEANSSYVTGELLTIL